MDRFRQERLNMRSSFADTHENESLPDLDAPASPAEIAQLQRVEALFHGCLPEGYVSLSSTDETSEGDEDETSEEYDPTDWEDLWNPVSELLTIPRSEFIGPLPDPPEIMARLTGFIRRFLACSEDQLTVLALWVLHTWCYQAFHLSPALNIYSDEKTTGKTVCLQLLHALCPEPWYVAAPAPMDVIQKTVDKPATILLDDRHLTFSSHGWQQVLNFLVCGLVDEERYFASHGRTSVKGYKAFSPRAFAGRGPLPAALADRSIPVCLHPGNFSNVKRIYMAETEDDCELLIDLMKSWGARNFNQLFYSGADRESPAEELAHLNVHQRDYVEPLLILADRIGGTWPQQARLALRRIFHNARNDKMNQSIVALHDVREAFLHCNDPDRLSTGYLVEYLCNLHHRPWAEWSRGKPLNGRSLALLLERFNIFPDRQRTGNGAPVRGYARNAFLPSWQQYCNHAPEAGCSTCVPDQNFAPGTAQPEAS